MRAQLLPKGCKRLGGDDVKIGDFLSLNFCCYNTDYSLISFLIFHILVCTINRDLCMFLCIFWLVNGGKEAGHMTSLKQRTATLRFRHDNGAQNSTDCFIEHRLETFLRQC